MFLTLGITASIFGLITSLVIHQKKEQKKRDGKKLLCPLRANCDKVISSVHSTVAGIPLENFGIAYYAFTGISYGIFATFPYFFGPWYGMLLIAVTIGAMLFSLYLIALQSLIIRAWCSLCMLSVLANVLLTVTLFGFQWDVMVPAIEAARTLWLMVHNVGFIIGLGAATVTDVLFFRFLKDHQISEEEKGTMDTLSSMIWIGLAILIISGIMLYVPSAERLAMSAKFLLKLVVIGVILFNGILLNIYVAPRLRGLSFAGTRPETHFRRIAFILGGISIFSWYSAFILGALRSIPLTFERGVLLYAGGLLIVIAAALIAERRMVHAIRLEEGN